jgi:hypothetical protein
MERKFKTEKDFEVDSLRFRLPYWNWPSVFRPGKKLRASG